MNFFEYFDAGHALITALVTIAALTPTDKDDYVLRRVKNIFSKISNLRRFLKKR